MEFQLEACVASHYLLYKHYFRFHPYLARSIHILGQVDVFNSRIYARGE